MEKLFSRRMTGRGSLGEKGWLETFVKDRAAEMALVTDDVEPEAFLRFCIEAAPPSKGERDTRRQRLVRTMRRLQEKGELPFRVEGDRFVL